MDKWSYMKFKNLCITREMVSKLKRPPTEWEKIFTGHTSDKRLITRIFRELKKLNSLKINEPKKKWETELNRTFLKEVHMAKKHMKKLLTIPCHKGNANLNHTRFHLTAVRIAIIKNTTNNKCWQGCSENGTLIHYWWECQLVQPLWKTI
jgi:hypothetical protein